MEVLFSWANKGPASQSYSFSSSHVWMWELDHKESWASKNWCFWTVVWEKILESPPWTARSSNQSILEEINLEYSLEGLISKLQNSNHLKQRADSLRKTLMLGKIERKRRCGRGWDGWMTSLTQWTWVWASSRSWWWTGKPACCSPWGHKESDTTERLNWTEYVPWIDTKILSLIINKL